MRERERERINEVLCAAGSEGVREGARGNKDVGWSREVERERQN